MPRSGTLNISRIDPPVNTIVINRHRSCVAIITDFACNQCAHAVEMLVEARLVQRRRALASYACHINHINILLYAHMYTYQSHI